VIDNVDVSVDLGQFHLVVVVVVFFVLSRRRSGGLDEVLVAVKVLRTRHDALIVYVGLVWNGSVGPDRRTAAAAAAGDCRPIDDDSREDEDILVNDSVRQEKTLERLTRSSDQALYSNSNFELYRTFGHLLTF